MSIEQAICTLITGNQFLKSIINDRLFPLYLPQGERRATIVYQQVGGSDGVTTDGPLGLVDARFQFTCWSSTHAGCVALANELLNILKGYSGIVENITIQKTQVVGRGDIPALSDQAEELTRYGKYIDVVISYNES